MQLSIVQIKVYPQKGELEKNFQLTEDLLNEAANYKPDVVIFPECFLDGYAIADKSIPLDTYRALGEPIPDGLNWDMWCGQTEPRPFNAKLYLPRPHPTLTS